MKPSGPEHLKPQSTESSKTFIASTCRIMGFRVWGLGFRVIDTVAVLIITYNPNQGS